MAHQIPYPGKRWSKRRINLIADQIFGCFDLMSENELIAVVKTAEQLGTNIGWQTYWCKDLIIKIANDRLLEIKHKKQKFKIK